MKNLNIGKSKKAFVFSLENQDRSTAVEKLKAYMESLRREGISVSLCEGSYRYQNGARINEISLFCEYETDLQLQALILHAESVEQESYLLIDEENCASVHFLESGMSIPLGTWQIVSQNVAHLNGSYTFFSGKYFVASSDGISIRGGGK